MELITARCHAQTLANDLQGAYWSDRSKDYLLECAHAAFAQLADAMGYDITKRPPAPQPATEPEASASC